MTAIVKRIFFVFMILSTDLCFAKPEIVNYPLTISDSKTFTITGNSLGVKNKPTPLLFVNAEGKNNGNIIEEGALIDHNKKYYYDSTQYHSKGVSLYTNVQRWPNGKPLSFDFGENGTDQVYFTFWTRLNFVSAGEEQFNGSQIKWYCIRGFITETQSGYGGYSWFWTRTGSANIEWKNMIDSVIYKNSYQGTVYWDGLKPSKDTWFRIEIYGKRSSGVGMADGKWITKCIQPSDNRVVNIVNNTAAVTHVDGDSVWRYAMWRNEITNAAGANGGEIKMWIDDIYIDNTQARIEIGNNNDWSKCTNREIQIPTTWAQDSITITANQGAFNKDDKTYLFVVDENGVASDGKEVFFDGVAAAQRDISPMPPGVPPTPPGVKDPASKPVVVPS